MRRWRSGGVRGRVRSRTSVAFRREFDEEHRTPSSNCRSLWSNLVTARGLSLIDERVAALEAGIAAATDAEAEKVLRRDLRDPHMRHDRDPDRGAGDGRRSFPSRATAWVAGSASSRWSATTRRRRR
ncbi:hypothetical protein AB5I41_24480 [Sphingomonas sp. MMS24-JH45]